MEGTVEKVSITPSTQPGWSDMVKILVAGIWYDVPGKAPRPAVGAAISFEAEQNQKGYWKARNIILTGMTQPTAPKAPTPTAATQQPQQQDPKDARISRQWAINAAIELVKTIYENPVRGDILKEAFILHRLATDPGYWERQRQILNPPDPDEGANDE
jgi:hypothetical protein